MLLNRNFSEFFESLNDNGVRYLVVGGYAVAFHGHPRYTKDIDVWIDREPANALRLLAALAAFGFGDLGLVQDDFLEEEQIIQLGNPPQRIDLLTSVPGVEFDDCYRRLVRVEIGGVTVDFHRLTRTAECQAGCGPGSGHC